jgi:hypothetical protein
MVLPAAPSVGLDLGRDIRTGNRLEQSQRAWQVAWPCHVAAEILAHAGQVGHPAL